MKRFLKKQLPAAFLVLVMVISLVPIASAASSDIKKSLDAGESVTFSRTEFRNLFDTEEDEDYFSYLEFTDFDDLDNYGYFYAYDYYDDKIILDEDTLENAYFYYDSSDVPKNYDYALTGLTFVADDDADADSLYLDYVLVGEDETEVYGTLEIEIGEGSGDDIVYTAKANSTIPFSAEDFYDYFEDNYPSYNYSLRYVIFDKPASSDLSNAALYYNYGKSSEEEFTRTAFANAVFYYDDSDYGDYSLDKLSFITDKSFSDDVSLTFRAYYNDNRYVDGTVHLKYSKSSSNSSKSDIPDADLEYEVQAGDDISFSRADFRDFFDAKFGDDDAIYYVEFTDAENLDDYGLLYAYDYENGRIALDESDLWDATFYYYGSDFDEDDWDAYYLDDLTFVADDATDGEWVSLDFTIYGEYGNKRSGTLVITIGEETASVPTIAADILYQTTTSANVQLKANDFSRVLQAKYPTSTLQYVQINGVSAVGGLYYNYYSASQYGTAARVKLTSANCTSQYFYLSPSSTAQYALSELTYVPSGTNYCAAIPFTAYGSGSKSVSGAVLISVTPKTIPEVYGVITKGTTVSLPAPSIATAANSGTGTSLYGIQFLSLPESTAGTVYVGTGTTRKADTSTVYGYSSGTWTISQLRFVPADGYTGSVEIPYAACDSSGNAIGIGKFCLGVVASQKKFSDVTSSTWCYKYVAELASAGVISGYSDGTFKPDSTISYGAALKLIMLAAGYGEQKPTTSNVFSGYLDKARSEGIITRSNVDLSKPITRLQIAQIAAGALKLDLENIPSVNPFNDTSDSHVRALNAIGVVEGYFSNGVSSYKPGNTLTRGQVSAIVWRMLNYVN